MSLYIQPDNQTYLWNAIHSHPKFQPHIRQYPPEKIAGWFRSTIEGFYRNWGENRPITPSELKQLNQNTVTYLYQSITSLNNSSTTAPAQAQAPVASIQRAPIPPPVQSGIPQPFQQNPALPKPLPEFNGQHEFEQRAQEYQAMNSKPMATPLQGQSDADQRESQEAMERKWMEQQRLREKDIEQFSPPSQVNGAQAINLNLLKSSGENGIMRNEEEKETIQMKIREYTESKNGGGGSGEYVTPSVAAVSMGEMPQEIPKTSILSELEKRLERIEQVQEKLLSSFEELQSIVRAVLQSSYSSTTNTHNKLREIDE